MTKHSNKTVNKKEVNNNNNNWNSRVSFPVRYLLRLFREWCNATPSDSPNRPATSQALPRNPRIHTETFVKTQNKRQTNNNNLVRTDMRMIFTPRLSLLSQPTTRYASRHRSFLFFYSLSKTLNNENELLFSFFYFYFLGYKWRRGLMGKEAYCCRLEIAILRLDSLYYRPIMPLFCEVLPCGCTVQIRSSGGRVKKRFDGSCPLYVFGYKWPSKVNGICNFLFPSVETTPLCAPSHDVCFLNSNHNYLRWPHPYLKPILGLCRLAFSEPNNEASSKPQWAIWPLFRLPHPFFLMEKEYYFSYCEI